MRIIICCIVSVCLLAGCCAFNNALEQAFANMGREMVVGGLAWGMQVTDRVYSAPLANSPYFVLDWPRWVAWRIARLMLVGGGFGLFSEQARADVGQTIKEIRQFTQLLMGD